MPELSVTTIIESTNRKQCQIKYQFGRVCLRITYLVNYDSTDYDLK